MNKKSQTLGLGIISAITFLIIGMMTINFLTPEIDRARSDLSCASPNDINDGIKLVCLTIDGVVPYYVIIIFSVIIGIFASRLNL
jgi:hypothetical protein